MARNEQILIIGAGPAGCAAAVQCERLGVRPHLLDRTGRAGGLVRNAFSVENYPGLRPTDGPAFATRLQEHIERFGLDVTHGEVTRLESLTTGLRAYSEAGEVRCKAVIAAVGTVPNPLDLPGVENLVGNGLYYHVSEVPKDTDTALLIGGGEAALDYGLTLNRNGVRCTIAVRGPAFRATGRLVDWVGRSDRISIQFNAVPLSIGRQENGVRLDVQTPAGPTHWMADAVIAAVGRHRATGELLKGLDVDPKAALSTPIPGLYVVGDARHGGLGQVGMAVGDGLAAAEQAVRFLRRGTE